MYISICLSLLLWWCILEVLPEHVCSHALLLEAVFAGRWLDIWAKPWWLSAPRHPPRLMWYCPTTLPRYWSSSLLWGRRRNTVSKQVQSNEDIRVQNECEYLWWCSALQAEASSSVSLGGQSELRADGPVVAQTSATGGKKHLSDYQRHSPKVYLFYPFFTVWSVVKKKKETWQIPFVIFFLLALNIIWWETFCIWLEWICMNLLIFFISSGNVCTHTAAGSDCDLDRVPSRLAYMFQVQGFVGGLVVSPLDCERRGVDADLDRCRPVRVHLTVFVVVALKLQLQVRPAQIKYKAVTVMEGYCMQYMS